MPRAWWSVLLVAFVCARAGASPEAFAAKAERAVASLRGATVGVAVVALDGDERRTVFARNADRPLVPASNLKLLTTAAALDALGPDFKFTTTLYRKGDTLALVGDGDPALGDSDLLAGTGWTSVTVFDQWAKLLDGSPPPSKLLVDDSAFSPDTFHPNWPRDQAHLAYVPQVAGVNLNANTLGVYLAPRGGRVSYELDPPTRYARVDNDMSVGANAVHLSRKLGTNDVILKGSTNAANREPWRVTIDDPALFAGRVLAERLGYPQLAVERDRTVRSRLQSDGWQPVAANETPLDRVLAHANKQSSNLYAECLLRRIAPDGSWPRGAEAVEAFAVASGAHAAEVDLDDGSGLSKLNRISPAAVCAVLARVHASPHRAAYEASLAVGGEDDSTLRSRFRNADALGGTVLAKTGYVSRVSALSGYARTRDNRTYAFSVIVNDAADVRAAKAAQDDVVEAILEEAP